MSEEEKEKAYKDKCPECGTEWSKTQKSIGGFWWHCKPCGKKAEDIPPKIPKYKGYDGTSSMMEEFEDMLGDWDDQDWKVF